jgi:predicted transcriptional regulator
MIKRIDVGGNLHQAAARVSERWSVAVAGNDLPALDTVTFSTWSALASVMTDKRLELLKSLNAEPADSIRSLARRLGRDYKRVHDDTVAMQRIGLVEKDDTGRLTADYGEIQTVIHIGRDAA